MPNFIKPQGEIATPGETETNALFHAGCIYLLGGSVGAAYDCFRQITPDRVSTLFNRALCCYRAKEYSGAFQLLAEAEQLSAHGNFGGEKTGTDALTEKLYEAERPLDGHRAPMPLVPASNRHARTQVLRLKAEVAYRLKMYEEVRRIASLLDGHYPQINDILSDINSSTPL